MPAIHLPRLRQQTAQLAQYFTQPILFVAQLHQLLDYYSDRVRRPGQSGEPPTLLKSYHAPKPVLRQIIAELTPLVEADPEHAFVLIDELWQQPYLEIRWLAAALLGAIPPHSPQEILDKVQTWLDPAFTGASIMDDELLEAILSHGLEGVRQASPPLLLAQIQVWLESDNVWQRLAGLRALKTLLTASDYENLPVCFRLLAPYARHAPLRLRADIVQILRLLAQRSPKETAFFLRQSVDAPDSPDAASITRQCLSAFPPDLQDGLRATLRELARSSASPRS